MSAQASHDLPDYGHKHRLPFKVVEWLSDDRGVLLNIVRAEKRTDYGMSKALARCIQRLSVCVNCRRAPFPVEGHAQCKRETSLRFETFAGVEIIEHAPASLVCQVVLPLEMTDVIRTELRADRNRANKLRRKRHLSKVTRREFARQKIELFALQAGHCYYCFDRFAPDGDVADFDHYVAIAQGGTNDIWNMVIACKTCNHNKATTPGTEFRAAIFRRLEKTTRRSLAALQAQVDASREQQLQEHLATQMALRRKDHR